MKRIFLALILVGVFLLFISYADNNTAVQDKKTHDNLVETTDIKEISSELYEDNPIDNAFAGFAEEHKTELNVDLIFSYLHALKWYNEYNTLRTEFAKELVYYINSPSDILSAAYEYGKSGTASDNLSMHFEGIARFYKMLALDCLEQLKVCGIRADIRSNEDEIFNYLKEVNFNGNYDYNDFEFISLVEAGCKPDPMPAIAGIDDEIFFLYSEFGAVLSVNGEQRLFLWNYLTPRAIMPRLELADFNADGNEELAVILYKGSGTGVSVEELHIVDTHYFSDICVTSREISDRIRDFSVSYDAFANEVEVKLNTKTIYVDVSDVPKEINPDFGGVDFGSIISFETDGEKLSVNISVGLYGFDVATSFDYVDFYADLALDENNNILLSNCRIEYNP